MSSGLVRYGSFSLEAADQVTATINAISAGSSFVKLEAGENVFRFLPPPLGRDNPLKVIMQHYLEALPGSERQRISFVCPRAANKEECPACLKSAQMLAGGNKSKEVFELARSLQPSLRILANVVPRLSPEPMVKILSFGKQIYDSLREIRQNARIGGDFTDPSANGFDIVIVRTGENRNTKYSVTADRNNTPLHHDPEVVNALIQNQHELDLYGISELPPELDLILQAIQAPQITPSRSYSIPQHRQTAPSPQQQASAKQPAQPVGAGLVANIRRPPPTTVDSVSLDYSDQNVEYDENFEPIKR